MIGLAKCDVHTKKCPRGVGNGVKLCVVYFLSTISVFIVEPHKYQLQRRQLFCILWSHGAFLNCQREDAVLITLGNGSGEFNDNPSTF